MKTSDEIVIRFHKHEKCLEQISKEWYKCKECKSNLHDSDAEDSSIDMSDESCDDDI